VRRGPLELLRDGWPIVAGFVIGIAIGATMLGGSTRYRAETRIVFNQQGVASSGVPPSVTSLVASGLLEQSVTDVLSVSKPQLSVSGGGDGVLRLRATAEDQKSAQEIDTEATSFLLRLVGERLAGIDANVVDGVHVTKLGPLPARDLLAGGMIGLSVGLLAAAGNLLRRRPEPAPDTHPETAWPPPQSRSDREAGTIGAGLPARDEPLRNVGVLEGLVAARSIDFPDRAEDWHTYILFLRGHADSAGRLPPHLDALVVEVFAPLLEEDDS
jgi:hypothetical protein